MNYVIWLEFDKQYTDFLQEKCLELEKNNIEPGIRPPHLTLTFVETNNYERLLEYVRFFFNNRKISITITTISQFDSGILFYGPIVNEGILSLHRELCDGLRKFGTLTWDLYVPDKWQPHIALTGQLSSENIIKATAIMKTNFKKTEVNISRVRIMDTETNEIMYINI